MDRVRNVIHVAAEDGPHPGASLGSHKLAFQIARIHPCAPGVYSSARSRQWSNIVDSHLYGDSEMLDDLGYRESAGPAALEATAVQQRAAHPRHRQHVQMPEVPLALTRREVNDLADVLLADPHEPRRRLERVVLAGWAYARNE